MADKVLICPEKILIGAAFKTEIAGLAEKLKPRLLAYSNLTIEFLLTGMGMKNVRHCLNGKTGNGYTAILNVGTAGAVRTDYEPLTVFYPHTVYAEIGSELQKIPSINPELFRQFPTWKSGGLFSNSRPVTTSTVRQVIYQVSQADVIDMEAFAYAEFCQRRKIPFYCLKVITDRADGDTPADFKIHQAAAAQKLTENVPLLIDSIMKINCAKVTPAHG